MVRNRRETRAPKRPIPSIASKNFLRRREKRAAAAAAANGSPSPTSPSPAFPPPAAAPEAECPLSPGTVTGSDELGGLSGENDQTTPSTNQTTPIASTVQGQSGKRYTKEQHLAKELRSQNKYLIRKCRQLHDQVTKMEREYKRMKADGKIRHARFRTNAQQTNEAITYLLDKQEGEHRGCYKNATGNWVKFTPKLPL
ncbi:hypothetical protein B0T21DRAFT_448044 [Apiosordaria backusii]|uniref:L1 transposable element trimerization domain-containing protein n=1 Tax=Apiosordaria backusii TaxID=314023 RepID=A0AA40K3V3_9PEZI|nr:hypothetical protein B0T21DRAFT_448044 [Apiosordaria backusii]